MVQRIDSGVAQIGSAAGISPVEEAEIVTLLEVDLEDHVGTTGRARGRAETEAHRAWVREEGLVGEEACGEVGAGKRRGTYEI